MESSQDNRPARNTPLTGKPFGECSARAVQPFTKGGRLGFEVKGEWGSGEPLRTINVARVKRNLPTAIRVTGEG